ncbi:MAG: hypothetical protein M1823_002767, partial [Watsoniomyces obsoletus]
MDASLSRWSRPRPHAKSTQKRNSSIKSMNERNEELTGKEFPPELQRHEMPHSLGISLAALERTLARI